MHGLTSEFYIYHELFTTPMLREMWPAGAIVSLKMYSGKRENRFGQRVVQVDHRWNIFVYGIVCLLAIARSVVIEFWARRRRRNWSCVTGSRCGTLSNVDEQLR